jgi:hypothetical protein
MEELARAHDGRHRRGVRCRWDISEVERVEKGVLDVLATMTFDQLLYLRRDCDLRIRLAV